MTDRLAYEFGSRLRDERLRRGWSLRELAERAAVSAARAHTVETGQRASLEMYARIAHALGLRIEADLVEGRRRIASPRDQADLVHAAMGELEASHLRSLGYEVTIDEPYQHYQFAGRADVVAWSTAECALLHIENRTRFPNLQEAAGSYNAKRAYLAHILAERLGIRGGFRSEAHVIVALWSAEVLHALRLRRATFQSLCPDPITALESWWHGHPPAQGRTSTLVVLDPFATGRARRYIDLQGALANARPRIRDYADAAGRLRSGRV